MAEKNEKYIIKVTTRAEDTFGKYVGTKTKYFSGHTHDEITLTNKIEEAEHVDHHIANMLINILRYLYPKASVEFGEAYYGKAKQLKSLHQTRVREFMVKCGQELPESPTIPDEEIRKLRATLILEECLETVNALGFKPILSPENGDWDNNPIIDSDELAVIACLEPDLVEIADGCADMSVVLQGTLLSCGIADEELFEEVDRTNLAKFSKGGHKREDGKWMKPPNWEPPKIAEILDAQNRE